MWYAILWKAYYTVYILIDAGLYAQRRIAPSVERLIAWCPDINECCLSSLTDWVLTNSVENKLAVCFSFKYNVLLLQTQSEITPIKWRSCQNQRLHQIKVERRWWNPLAKIKGWSAAEADYLLNLKTTMNMYSSSGNVGFLRWWFSYC